MPDNKQRILVVDDIADNIDLLVEILKPDYHIQAAKSGEMALRIVNKTMPDLILLDIMMPGMDGYEVCRRLKEDLTTRHIPVIFVSAKMTVEDELQGFDAGAVDYITKPVSPPLVKARVRTHLALHDQNRELNRKVREQTEKLRSTRLQIIQRLGRAAEYKDNETGLHVIRMSHYCHILGLAAGMDEEEAELLLNAAPMHDIGKIGIPDSILRKPGKLTEDEMAEMKKHCEIGAEILGDDESDLLDLARIVALTHHERWDGAGYPAGLSGENIPRVGRIVAIADVFDALTSERPYKQAWTVGDALGLIKQEAGTHFDPELVKLFEQSLPQILEVKDRYADPDA
ncbi:HD domain-containing phosphohydrolase [Marinobacter sp.]|uniref:HD-GYP domain-containing protein n=1 Tax=Marinobacter sp. TaxID=50741 RepID=UPI0019C1C1AD|nr:HD domain-containing phosphohydrolase [Marinobacter sp.]MBD3657098.1 response regulator [Marinobacter sp.]